MITTKFQNPKSLPRLLLSSRWMVGLGCGARSYTDTLHYSNDYAVGAREVQQILQAYIKTPLESFDYVNYGFQLDAEDRRRRFILWRCR